MKLQNILNQYSIRSVWHFTDRSNLDSIFNHGILSLNIIEKNGIKVSCFGADSLSHNLDRRYGLDKYVHISFIKEHPMLYVKKRDNIITNPVWIAICASVLLNQGVIFSTTVANANNAKVYPITKLDNEADLEVLWGRTNWSDSQIKERRKNAKKGEIMIPSTIKRDKILGVYNG